MSVTQALIDQINAQKEIIEQANQELENLMRESGDYMAQERYRQYVKGGLEQACSDFGCHNTCIESIVKDLEEEIEDEQFNYMMELAISIGQEDALGDKDHLKDRLAYWVNGEYNDDEADQKQAQIDGLRKLIALHD